MNPEHNTDSAVCHGHGKKIAACTLGCKVNSYDTEAMMNLFSAAGYEIVDFDDCADIYIVNTCTVTNLSNKKSRQMLRRARGQNPGAIIVATGCYAQVAPEEVGHIEGVNLVLGTKNRGSIVEEVEQYTASRGVACHVSSVAGESAFESLSISAFENRTRAFLKIQEGCAQFCTYCIIPYARGPVRSREPEDVLAQARTLAANGFKEIVLAGIHVASYGNDLADTNLLNLLEQVHDINGIARIRFSSIEPTLVDARFVGRIKELPKICDHFHLSLQSGCDKTLRRMNRKYTSAQYEQAVLLLRKAFPDVAITTDVIVGFPGESDSDFEESFAFVEKMALSKLHVFPYSPKDGTPAAAFKEQVPSTLKHARSKRMIALGDALSRQFIKNLQGRTVDVLYETAVEPDVYEGHTSHYVKVLTHSAKNIAGDMIGVRISGAEDGFAVSDPLI